MLNRFRLIAISVLVFLICSKTAFSQTATSVRDPQALTIIEQALGVLGGAGAQLQLRTAVVQGIQQGNNGDNPSPFLWEDDLSGQTPEFHKELREPDATHTLVSGHGKPSYRKDAKSTNLLPQVAWSLSPLHLPGVVLVREIQNQSYSVQLVNDSSLLHVRTLWALNSGTASATAQDWYFDPVTKLPVQVKYVMPDNQYPSKTMAGYIEFGDFRSVTGVVLPFKIVGHAGNQAPRTFVVGSVQLNTTIDPSHFEANGGQQ